MRTIWKYPLDPQDLQTLSMPSGARILGVLMQGGTPCLWATVDDEAPREPRRIRIFGTGRPIGDILRRGSFIGTVQDGPFVWHVFEEVVS